MLLASTGTPQGPFGFAGGHGYQEDADSGLKLLGHRYYDASTGRFLTRDPARHGRNWYAYCGDNPTTRVDPDGLSELIKTAVKILIFGLGCCSWRLGGWL
jgi:RHS repeat-associated protein